jgi:hypothetical protein
MIKPEFFDDPDVADVSLAARLCFIGLWTQADREGRLVDDQRRLKVRLFPYDDVEIADLLDELVAKGMVISYRGDDGRDYLFIRKFSKHQRPHPKEPASVIPVPPSKTVASNGEPCKNISDPSESGVLSLESGTRNLDQKDKAAARTPRPSASRSEPPTENFRIITKIAHEAIDIEGIDADLGQLADAVKSLCAIRSITYNSDVVRKAVDSALAQRRKAS